MVMPALRETRWTHLGSVAHLILTQYKTFSERANYAVSVIDGECSAYADLREWGNSGVYCAICPADGGMYIVPSLCKGGCNRPYLVLRLWRRW